MATYFNGFSKLKKGNYGIKMSANADKLIQMIKENAVNGWINLELKERKEVDKYGNTHTMVIDDWKPNAGFGQATPANAAPQSDDLPF